MGYKIIKSTYTKVNYQDIIIPLSINYNK